MLLETKTDNFYNFIVSKDRFLHEFEQMQWWCSGHSKSKVMEESRGGKIAAIDIVAYIISKDNLFF